MAGSGTARHTHEHVEHPSQPPHSTSSAQAKAALSKLSCLQRRETGYTAMTVRRNVSERRLETVIAVGALEPKLTPELKERLLRMASKERKQPDTMLCQIVQDQWVRFAARNRLPPSEW